MTHILPASRAAQPSALALAGFGTPSAVGLRQYLVTALNRTPPNSTDDLVISAAQPKARLSRQVYACSEDFPCDPFAHDMLSRSAAIADGNAFFGDYDPAAYRRSAIGRTGGPGPVDLAIQYRSEAVGALKALDGLNIPPDLLIRSAFVAQSAARLCAAGHAPSKDEALTALAQLCVRLLCDQPSAAEAKSTVTAFLEALNATFDQTGLASA